jgi:hypothetical protein
MEVEVDIEALSTLHVRNPQSRLQGDNPASALPLSLMIRPDETSKEKIRMFDLNNVDFMGPASVMKAIFTLQHDSNRQNSNSNSSSSSSNQKETKAEIFAIHKIGNAILLDAIPVHEDAYQEFAPASSQHSRSTASRNTASSVTRPPQLRLFADGQLLSETMDDSFRAPVPLPLPRLAQREDASARCTSSHSLALASDESLRYS